MANPQKKLWECGAKMENMLTLITHACVLVRWRLGSTGLHVDGSLVSNLPQLFMVCSTASDEDLGKTGDKATYIYTSQVQRFIGDV